MEPAKYLRYLDFLRRYLPHFFPKNMSHAAATKEADAKVEARLLKLLGQDTEWLYVLRYQHGLEWLAAHFGFDPRLERALAMMPGPQGGSRNLFWGWWLNDWQHRDTIISASLKVLQDGTASYNRGSGVLTVVRGRAELMAHYLDAHNPKAMQIRLPGFVLEEAKKWLRTALPEE